MIGITLSPEQISQAPPEARRWLEQQIVGLLNASRAMPAMQPPERHLIGCDPATARGILSLINDILPVVSVFFELAREPAVATAQGLRALRLDEMARHARIGVKIAPGRDKKRPVFACALYWPVAGARPARR